MRKKVQYKKALMTCIAIYPSLTLMLWLFGEPLGKLCLLLRTLILTRILIALLSYVLLPLLQELFENWCNS